MDLFEYQAQNAFEAGRPLAERMRPTSLKDFVGQTHVVGECGLIRRAVDNNRIFSMILWGPPGCGKTSLARIIAGESRSYFVHFSAVLSGVKEIRSVITDAKEQQKLFRKRTILFVDEIHRFNKAQQDAFLPHVESGLLTLIGATTENPSFEVIPPLLSRCRVITLHALSHDEVTTLVKHSLEDTEKGLGNLNLKLASDALSYLVEISEGDARVALNSLEIAASLFAFEGAPLTDRKPGEITRYELELAFQKKALIYDKHGEAHYNLISAFHKCLRGSDPDAALYWLSRMISAGENPLYIARRMVRFASEDVGNADPHALGVALGAMEAFRFLGSPEGELALAQAAVYLATALKSNSIYTGYNSALDEVRATGSLQVPLHIRNAPTRLMKTLRYGKDYQYPHDHEEGVVFQEYLPDELKGRHYYFPTDRGYEKIIKQRLETWRSLMKNAAFHKK